MIDSIVLRIHNTSKYKKLIETIRNSGKNLGLRQSVWLSDNLNFDTNFLEIVETQYFDSDKFNVRMNDKVYLPSSHYLLAWKADYQKDYIEFNFSIPKLIYGTNVIQFIRHQDENQSLNNKKTVSDFFDYSRQSKMSKNMNDTYERLVYFIERFCLLHLQWSDLDIYGKTQIYSVDKSDLEVNRIDICFNQIFDSEKEALQYLELQKDIRKKYEKDGSKSSRGWKTSIWMRTDKYIAKIYHKGSEYANNDLKHHLKINRTARKNIFDTKALQEFADRTLRYEISFKGAYLSYIFKTKIFRKEDKFHNKLKSNFDFCKSIESKISRRRKLIQKMTTIYSKQPMDQKDLEYKAQIYKIAEEKKKLEKKLDEYLDLTYFNRVNQAMQVIEKRSKLAVIYSNMISLQTKFFLDCSKIEKIENQKTVEFSYRETTTNCVQVAQFSKELLSECFNVFKDFFKQFQIKERKDFNALEELIKEYNKKAESLNLINEIYIKNGLEKKVQTLNTSSLVRIWEYTRNNSWEQLQAKGIIKRSSVFRYKSIFEKIGIQKNEFSPIPLNPSMDFEKYHSLLFNKCQLKMNNIYFY